MPTYDYRCTLTDQVVEVRHAMNEEVRTWGELCGCAELEPGDTPADTPVVRLATGGQVVKNRALKNPEPPCASGGACCGGGEMCGL
jgi:hypothetical protein